MTLGTRRGAVLLVWLAACGEGLPADPNPFGAPRPVAIQGYAGVAMEPALSPDGQLLLFNDSNASGVDTDLRWATRLDDLTFVDHGPLAGANSTALDAVPSMDEAGNLYFISLRAYTASHRFTVHRGVFAAGAVTGVEEVPGLESQGEGWVIFDAFVSRDGTQLWFAEGYYGSGSLGAASLRLAERTATGFVRSPGGVTLLEAVNPLGATTYAPAVSADGLELYFTRIVGAGATAVFRSRRPNTASPWGAPAPIEALAGGLVEAAAPTADGKALYYHRQVGSTFRVERVTRN